MAEALLSIGPAPSTCATCGTAVVLHEKIPATFCMECGCCVLNLPRGGSLPPLVPPHVLEEGAWRSLEATIPEGAKAVRRSARLLFVPFHEWEPDVGRRRLLKDARAVLSPAADLLPAGLRVPASAAGDDVGGLAIAEVAHRGRLADPRGALDLIRLGEVVDPMIEPAHPAPAGAAGGAMARLLYYPFWHFTYAVDHKERSGVVDATNGLPVGASAPPRRWRPPVAAGVAGAVTFALAWLGLGALLPAWIAAVASALLSWVAAFAAFKSAVTAERGR